MRTMTIALLAGIGALAAAGSAKASDVYTTSEYANPDLAQQVRRVCDDAGRCYRTHNGARVIVRDSYKLHAARTLLRAPHLSRLG
jgi:hypothetical protein